MKKSIVGLLSIVIFSFLFSCNNEGEKNSLIYNLTKVDGRDVSYKINDSTRFMFASLFLVEDSNRKYLSFLANRTNNILFYDLKSGEFLFQLSLDREGSNGVGMINGFYVKDLNNIYITTYQKEGLIKVDTSGVVKRFIPYKETSDGFMVRASFSSVSAFYTPPIFVDDKIYITQHPSQFSTKSETPLSVCFDTLGVRMAGLPFTHPSPLSDTEFPKYRGNAFSRDFNGEYFVYSFNNDHNIYITSKDHKEIKVREARSRYVSELKLSKFLDPVYGHKFLLETFSYGNLIYDKYRNVYYRIVNHGIKTDAFSEEEIKEIYQSGHPRFSIMILDNDFNIIGETLFPDSVFINYVMFIDEDGLYISDSHILNPDFDENNLSFKCFNLKEL